MITVYGDLLFAINFFMDYMLLRLTALAVKRVTVLRSASGALLGAIYATTIFFLDIPTFITFISEFASMLIMIAVAFGIKNFRTYLKSLGTFLVVSLLCGGVVSIIFMSGGAFIVNGTIYFSSGIRNLIFASAAAYIIIKLICRIFDKFAAQRSGEYNLKITLGAKTITAVALYDTGNILHEPFTGLPVCILCRSKYLELMPLGEKIYIIPYKTISGEKRVMTGIKPDNIIATDISGKQYKCNCIVAVTDTEIKKGLEAIISPYMLADETNYEKPDQTERLHSDPT